MRTIKDKALAVIENLTSSDFCLGLDYRMYEKKLTKTEKRCIKLLGQIYKVSHALACKERGVCSHPDWEEEINELYKKL